MADGIFGYGWFLVNIIIMKGWWSFDQEECERWYNCGYGGDSLMMMRIIVVTDNTVFIKIILVIFWSRKKSDNVNNSHNDDDSDNNDKQKLFEQFQFCLLV